MGSEFWTKDPTRLPCTQCGETLDAGATLRSAKLIRRGQLACPHCGVQLKKQVKSYWPWQLLFWALLILPVFTGGAEPWASTVRFELPELPPETTVIALYRQVVGGMALGDMAAAREAIAKLWQPLAQLGKTHNSAHSGVTH